MKKIVLLIYLVFFTTNLFSQTTYTVDNKPGAPADFDNLQTAIDTAAPGDILLVQGSPTGYGNNIIMDKQLTIIGSGYFLGQNPNTQAYQLPVTFNINLIAGASNSAISGISGGVFVTDISNISINYIMGSTHIVNSHSISVFHSYLNGSSQIYGNFYGNFIDGICSNIIFKGNYIATNIYTTNGASLLMVSLNNNVLGLIGGNSIIAFSEFKNNIVMSPDDVYFGYDLTDYSNVQNNIVAGSSQGDEGVNGNHFNIDMTTVFIDSIDPRYTDDGKYILKAGSPAIGAGTNGDDCGMFGGDYRLSGIPNIPNIYEFVVPDTGYTNESGIDIQVKVKSNN